MGWLAGWVRKGWVWFRSGRRSGKGESRKLAKVGCLYTLAKLGQDLRKRWLLNQNRKKDLGGFYIYIYIMCVCVSFLLGSQVVHVSCPRCFLDLF